MTTRKHPKSATARTAFLKEHNATCHICNGAIQPGDKWDVDHVIALELGGADEPANWRPAHMKCHRGPQGKTARDLEAIAKAKRREAAHIGAKPKGNLKSAGFPKADRPERNKIGVPPRRGFYEVKPND